MSYTRWFATWQNLPSHATAANAGFLQHVEDALVSQDSRLTTLESGGTVSGVATVTAGDSTILVAGTSANPNIKVNTIPESKVTGLVVDLSNKADLVSGKVPTTELGSGSASSTTFLRGDQTWSTPSGGGSGTVTSVTAGDTSITVAGSSAAPTIAINAAGTPSSSTFLRGDRQWAVPPSGSNNGADFAPCRLATTANIAINSVNTLIAIDGITPNAGDRILVKDENTIVNNGIWIANAGSWTRATDMASGSTVVPGATIAVHEGSKQSGVLYNIHKFSGSVGTPITVGADGMTFVSSVNRVLTNGSVIPNQPSINLLNGFSVSNNPVGKSVDVSITAIPPSSYLTVNPDSNSLVALTPGDNNYYCLLTQNATFAALDPNYQAYTRTLVPAPPATVFNTSVGAKIRIVIQQDSVGSRIWEFSPSTIAWDNGVTYTTGPYAPVMFDLTANSITYVELIWMGDAVGWFGRFITGIPPLYDIVPASFSWTTTSGWPAKLGLTAVNTQLLGFPVVFGRNMHQTVKNFVYDALTKSCSATMRTRLAVNHFEYEFGARFNADGPGASSGRASTENFGGYTWGASPAGAANFATFGQISSFPFGAPSVNELNNYGGIVHELCHAISIHYYGGDNSMPGVGVGNGSEPAVISTHSTLVTLKTDCINNGDSVHPPNAGDEWFAETERYRRFGDNGTLLDTGGDAANSSIQAQMGTLTNAGPGGTGGTPNQRYTRFVNYVTSLYGNN